MAPVNAAAWFQALSDHLGFVVGKLAVGQISVPLLSFSHVSVVPLVLHIYSFVIDTV